MIDFDTSYKRSLLLLQPTLSEVYKVKNGRDCALNGQTHFYLSSRAFLESMAWCNLALCQGWMWLRAVRRRILVAKVQKDQQNQSHLDSQKKKDPLCFRSQETSLHEFNLLNLHHQVDQWSRLVGYQFQTRQGFHEWGSR